MNLVYQVGNDIVQQLKYRIEDVVVVVTHNVLTIHVAEVECNLHICRATRATNI